MADPRRPDLPGGRAWCSRWRAARTDRTRAAVVLWGGWLLVTGLVFSYAQGIIHPYYNVALAPAVGALVGIGTVTLWHHRRRAAVPGSSWPWPWPSTAVWSYVLLSRSPTWLPWLRPAVLAVGIVVAVVVAADATATGPSGTRARGRRPWRGTGRSRRLRPRHGVARRIPGRSPRPGRPSSGGLRRCPRCGVRRPRRRSPDEDSAASPADGVGASAPGGPGSPGGFPGASACPRRPRVPGPPTGTGREASVPGATVRDRERSVAGS